MRIFFSRMSVDCCRDDMGKLHGKIEVELERQRGSSEVQYKHRERKEELKEVSKITQTLQHTPVVVCLKKKLFDRGRTSDVSTHGFQSQVDSSSPALFCHSHATIPRAISGCWNWASNRDHSPVRQTQVPDRPGNIHPFRKITDWESDVMSL